MMRLVLRLIVLLLIATPAMAQNGLTVGSLTLAGNLQAIGYKAAFTGDANATATATVRFKRSSGSTWSNAYPPIVDRRATVTSATGSNDNTANQNQARGSIVGLSENTAYDVELTWIDADGVTGSNPVTGSITTAPLTPPTGGTTYFVNSTTGNNSNAGTSSGAAWATLVKGFSTALAGDTINCNGTFAALTIAVSGTSTAFRKLQNESGQSCTISGSTDTIAVQGDYLWLKGLTLGASTTGSLVSLGSHHHVYVTDSTAADFSTSGTWMTGAIAMNGAHDIFVLRNSFTRTSTTIAASGSPGTNGVAMQGANSNIVIDSNVLTGAMWDAIGNSTNSALTGTDNVDYSNNTITEYWDDSIEIDGGAINLRVWGNSTDTTVLAGSKNLGDNGATGLSEAGTLVGPSYIFRNYIVSHGNVAVKGGHYSPGWAFYFHNTIVATRSSGGIQALSQGGGAQFSQNHTFRNNIFQSNNQNVWTQEGNRTGNTYDYDVLWGNGAGTIIDTWDTTGAGVNANYSTLAAFQAANPTQEVHGKYGNPSLDSSYHITSSSNAVDAGASIDNFNTSDSAWPALGAAPDIGAFEVGSGAIRRFRFMRGISPGE